MLALGIDKKFDVIFHLIIGLKNISKEESRYFVVAPMV